MQSLVETSGKTSQQNISLKEEEKDPLKKRENFAVALRKQKRQHVITSKRKRTFDFVNDPVTSCANNLEQT